jgi:phosphoglycerol transferase MdoB-like AlkP superfamily enzyme
MSPRIQTWGREAKTNFLIASLDAQSLFLSHVLFPLNQITEKFFFHFISTSSYSLYNILNGQKHCSESNKRSILNNVSDLFVAFLI